MSWWLLREFKQDQADPSSHQIERPDFTMSDFTATNMDASGSPEQRLSATFMSHYPHDGSSEYERPHLIFFATEGAPWNLWSDRAWMDKDGDMILFRGDVKIEREASEFNHPVKVFTHNLRIRPRDKIANSEAPTSIFSPNLVVKGTGMQLNWASETLEIKSNAKGKYEFD